MSSSSQQHQQHHQKLPRFPLHTIPSLLYPSSPANVTLERIQSLISAHTEKTKSPSLPQTIVRSPGRVNLIGEHIDYSGYSVLPMAIEQDILIAASFHPSPPSSAASALTIHLASTIYPSPATTLTFPDGVITIDASAHFWGNYVLCGLKDVVPTTTSGGGGGDLYLTVTGNIPPAAGLSSSSALVCASVVAGVAVFKTTTTTTHAHEYDDRHTVVRISTAAERFVGVESGGMDQAISVLADARLAKNIEFDPVRAHDVHLPLGGTWIVLHSLVNSEKQRTAAEKYNKRVIECRLAALVLLAKTKKEGVDGVGVVGTTLKTVQEYLEQTPQGMLELVARTFTHHRRDDDGGYTIGEVEELLGINNIQSAVVDLHQAKKVFTTTTDDDDDDEKKKKTTINNNNNSNNNGDLRFRLRERAAHVYAETLRVAEFVRVCGSNDVDDTSKLQALGAILNAGQRSCAELYECSCPELDRLTSSAVQHGALGARLTGAGWGGCAVALVRDQDVAQFMQAMRSTYYAHVDENDVKQYMFASKPMTGAGIITDFLPST